VTNGASNTIAGVVLFPGAGSSASHASLVSLEEALSPLPVARIDFPYRRAGKSFPDKTPVLLECVRNEVRAFAEQLGVQTSQLLIGGRSMGGRMCSMAVTDEADPLHVAALVLMSYPLHPPKKPENLRTEHLPRIAVPTLCISGTKDNFGSPEELESAFSVVPAHVQWHWVQNGRHELAKADAEIADTVLQFIQTV
jgi:predicted alpha/beta-hydrolase family hydrolase